MCTQSGAGQAVLCGVNPVPPRRAPRAAHLQTHAPNLRTPAGVGLLATRRLQAAPINSPRTLPALQGLLKIADLGVSAELARVFTNVQVG